MAVPRVGMSPTQSDTDQIRGGSRTAQPGAIRIQDDMEVGTSEDSQSGRSSQSSFVDNKTVSRLQDDDQGQGDSSCDSTDSKPEGSDPIDSISGMLGEIFRKVKTKFKDGNKDEDQKRDSDTSENQTDQPVKRKRGRPPKKKGGQKNKEDDNNSDNDGNDSVQTRRRSSRLKTLEQNSEGGGDGERKKEKRGRKPKVKLEQDVPIVEASGESPSALPLRPSPADFAVPR